MKITSTSESVIKIDADAVVVTVCSAESSSQAITGPAADIDKATGGVLTRLFENNEVCGKRDEITALLAPQGVKALQVVVIGTGKEPATTRDQAFRSAATAAKHLSGKARKRVAFYLGSEWSAELNESGICGVMIGSQGQDLYKTEKKCHPFEEMLWAGGDEVSLGSGEIFGESVNLTRRLVNEPPSVINPESFATEAERVAKEYGLEIEVWDQARLKKEKCEALLAVGRASAKESRLVIMRHNGGKKGDAPLALVGKGVTFDSGGLSLKPSEGMKTMKCDMAGAATVLGAMQAIARLQLPVNVIGLMGLAENMISGDSYRLGDVLTARNGKTIEVLNTDAEGRLVLADTLCVAVDNGAAKIIDLATLTGACLVALGTDITGLMTNDQAWCDAVSSASKTCGEQTWQLPMFPEFSEQIKSDVADIKNIGKGRWGGTITAAKFLEEFVAETPWVHMDIAGPSFIEDGKSWIDNGGSGCCVRTLVEVARNWKG